MPVETVGEEIRIRVMEPGLFEQDSFRRIIIQETKPRIFAIIGKLKGETSTTIQSYRFPLEDGWTESSASDWVDKHKESKSMATKYFTQAVKKEFNDNDKTLIAWASKAVVDRSGEVILPGAWDIDKFTKNPVIILSHDYSKLPVGKALWVKLEKDGLKMKVQFASTPAGEEAYTLYKEGVLNAFSVGFLPKLWDEGEIAKQYNAKRVYQKCELLEVSVVSVPACPDALVERAHGGQLVTKEFIELVDSIETHKKLETSAAIVKASVDKIVKALSHNNDVNEDEPDWAGVDKTKLPLKAFVWEAPGTDEEQKSTWTYPHHYVVGGEVDDSGILSSGDMYLHRAGLNAAWGAAMGARSGEKADEAVMMHLSKHREALGMDEEAKGFVAKTKAVDEAGNVSALDIVKAIEAKMNKPINGPYAQTQYWYRVEDLYPVNYPDGHFIVEVYAVGAGSTNEYWRYDYRYNGGDVDIFGGLRMEEVYQPKRDEVSIMQESAKIMRKAGAVLSTRNRDRVQRFRDMAAECVNMADELLKDSMKPMDEEKPMEPMKSSDNTEAIIKAVKDVLTSGMIRNHVKAELSRITGRV